jgi:hypothetical protein
MVTGSPEPQERTGEPPTEPTKRWLRGLEADGVIHLLLGSRERVGQSGPGIGHVCRVHLVPDRGGLLPRCGVAPFLPPETMNPLSKNSLTGPAVHVQHAAVLHNLLFRVPAPAPISTHNCVLLPQIFLNYRAFGTALQPSSASMPGEILENSFKRLQLAPTLATMNSLA